MQMGSKNKTKGYVINRYKPVVLLQSGDTEIFANVPPVELKITNIRWK